MTPNFKKILKRKEWFLSNNHDYMQPENRHFYPFYVFDNFEVKNDEPVYCDYCGCLLDGNGLYATAYFVFESDNDIRVCCNIHKCHPAKVWDFHDQKHGQPEPLKLPEQSTIQQRMVFHYFFSGKSYRYEVMKYKRIDEKLLFEICHPSEAGGGTYEHDGARFIQWKSKKLIISKDFDSPAICTLTVPQIVNIVNELLASMNCMQLKLF